MANITNVVFGTGLEAIQQNETSFVKFDVDVAKVSELKVMSQTALNTVFESLEVRNATTDVVVADLSQATTEGRVLDIANVAEGDGKYTISYATKEEVDETKVVIVAVDTEGETEDVTIMEVVQASEPNPTDEPVDEPTDPVEEPEDPATGGGDDPIGGGGEDPVDPPADPPTPPATTTITVVPVESNKSLVSQFSEQTSNYAVNYELGGKKVKGVFRLVNEAGEAVALGSVFEKFEFTATDSVGDPRIKTATTIADFNEVSEFDFLSNVNSDFLSNVSVKFAFNGEAEGKYKFVLAHVDEDNTEVSHEEFGIEVVTAMQALTKYEKLVETISDSDLSALETQKSELEATRAVAKQAIDSLEEGETKEGYMERYNQALNNQNEGYKLYYLYKSKNSHLSLYKVKNVGGNVPFKVVFNDEKIVVGDASEAFYYVPNSNQAVDFKSSIVPKQKHIAFGSTNIADGEYFYITKIGETFYRTSIVAQDGVIASVNGIDIDASEISEQGGSFTAPGMEVNKSALNDALAEAEALNNAHEVGETVGKVPQAQKDAFEEAIASAKAVADDDEALESEVTSATEAIKKATTEFDSFIVDYTVDKAGLSKAIADYTAVANAMVVGTNVGEVSQEALDALHEAIVTATDAMNAVDDSVNYDDEEAYNKDVKAIADALEALETAKAEFDKHVVTTASFADAKLKLYETAAEAFLNSVRKKIRI